MKGRNDFKTEAEYREYLRHFYACHIAAGIISNPAMMNSLGGAHLHDGSGENEAIAKKALDITNTLIEKI